MRQLATLVGSRCRCERADETGVKGVEKLTAVRLAEALVDRGVVASEVITDALYAQEAGGDAFVQTLVEGAHITEWDLAKLVTEYFNLPFLLASRYQISEAARERLPKETLFRHTLVPLDVFDDIVCVAMPVMLTFDQISTIHREHNCTLFPYVGLISENKKVLSEMFRDYSEWLGKQSQAKKPTAPAPAAGPTATRPGDWMSIFDAGEQAIRATVKKPGQR